MTTELIIALLAGDTIIAGTLSSVVTWLLSRKKYNSEVDQNNIQNMQESLDFYIKLSDDYKQRLSSEIEEHNKEVADLKEENAELRRELSEYKKELRDQEKKFDSLLAAQQKEISMMKNQMLSVYSQVCLNFNCLERATMKPLGNKGAYKNKKSVKPEIKKNENL